MTPIRDNFPFPLMVIRFLIFFLFFIENGWSKLNTLGMECTGANNICKLPDEESLRFYILGDWGGKDQYPYITDVQNETVQSVFSASHFSRPHFYLSTGDNFYVRGVKSVDDKRFNTTFDWVYLYGKKENIPWYITAGNHDYYGNIQAQLDYSKVNPRWVYPELSYSVRYSFGRNPGVTVEMHVVDTIVLCGGTTLGGWNPDTKVYVRPNDRPTGPSDPDAAAKLWKWLERNVKKSKADYLFVIGHYPIYSNGIHGDTQCLRQRLPAILKKYRVNAYIAGHEHHLQHAVITTDHGWTVNQVVSGAASKFDRRPSQRPQQYPFDTKIVYTYPTMKDVNPKGGYVYVDVRDVTASFEYYKSDGSFLYSFNSERRT